MIKTQPPGALLSRVATVIREFSVIWLNQIAGTFMLYRNGTKGGQMRIESVFICTIWHGSSTYRMLYFILSFFSKINLGVIL